MTSHAAQPPRRTAPLAMHPLLAAGAILCALGGPGLPTSASPHGDPPPPESHAPNPHAADDDAIDDFDPNAGLIVRASGHQGSDAPGAAAGILPEGAYLSQRRGVLTRLDSGVWIYLFDADASGNSDPPMVVLPSLALMQMQRLVESRHDPAVRFKVSGRVLLYRNRNFLLPTFGATLIERAATGAAAQPAEASARPAARQPGPHAPDPAKTVDDLFGDAPNPADDPRVEDLVADLEEQQATLGAFVLAAHDAQAGATAAEAPDSRPSAAVLEGTLLSATRGHVTRDTAGAWIFTTDNDADAPADPSEPDRPLIILPCQALEQLEAHAEAGRPLRFRIAGTILAYESRAYILPSLLMLDIDTTGNITTAR